MYNVFQKSNFGKKFGFFFRKIIMTRRRKFQEENSASQNQSGKNSICNIKVKITSSFCSFVVLCINLYVVTYQYYFLFYTNTSNENKIIDISISNFSPFFTHYCRVLLDLTIRFESDIGIFRSSHTTPNTFIMETTNCFDSTCRHLCDKNSAIVYVGIGSREIIC